MCETAGGWITGGSEVKVWRDISEEVEKEKVREREGEILKEQEMEVRGSEGGEPSELRSV